MTSLCVPLEIGGHTDGDGENLPAPVVVKLEGAERGKSGGTAPAVNTPAPDKPTGLAGDACCECGQQSSCNTARCGCWVVGRNCVSCRCLVQCANVAPQTWQDKQQTTQIRPGGGEGRRRGKRQLRQGNGGPTKARAEGLGKNTKNKNKTKKQMPRDDRTFHSYHRDQEPVRARGGRRMMRRVTQRMGKVISGMRPGTFWPWKTYVSGRSTDNGSTGTRAHTWTAGSRKTGHCRGGDMTSRSCHRNATKRRAGRWRGATSTPW